ncbi:MAG: hypothetical protein O7D91_01650 [Planctomycetota bacterium]|nr:hypothetical protein [Planctomycetota bacterium]
MATDDGIDFGAHRPLRQAFPYLPEDPTIPRPDQYSDLSIGDLLLVCEFWRFGALHWLRREKPDEFRRVFDSLLGRDDPAIQSMRELIIEGKVESARSAYFFSEFKFAYLTEIVVRACKGFGVDPQSVHEFLDYRDADPMSAIRAVGLLEWRLNGELTQEPTANLEPEDAEHDPSRGKQPAEDQRPTVDLDSKACAYHIAHPEWAMKQLADELGCSRPHLYKLPMLTKLRELLKTGKFNLPAGTKYDGSVEAWKKDPDGRTCPACGEEHEFVCTECAEDERHCPVCHIQLRHPKNVTD